MSYEMDLWSPAKRDDDMTTVLTRAAKLISSIGRDALHTAFFMDSSVNQDVVIADLDVLMADEHCYIAHAVQRPPSAAPASGARQYARQTAAATAAALYAPSDPGSP